MIKITGKKILRVFLYKLVNLYLKNSYQEGKFIFYMSMFDF